VSAALDEARTALLKRALDITPNTWADPEFVKALCVSAREYTAAYDKARSEAKPAPTGVADHRENELTLPFGRSKGRVISAAATDDLEWILPKIVASIDDPTKSRWRVDNQALADAIEAELETR
jgi:hypothetical protein